MRSYRNALRAIGDGNDQQTRDYDERIVGGFAGLGSSEEGKANVKNTWQRTIRSGIVNMLNNSLSSVSHAAPKSKPPAQGVQSTVRAAQWQAAMPCGILETTETSALHTIAQQTMRHSPLSKNAVQVQGIRPAYLVRRKTVSVHS